jgi:hypothetical protein
MLGWSIRIGFFRRQIWYIEASLGRLALKYACLQVHKRIHSPGSKFCAIETILI